MELAISSTQATATTTIDLHKTLEKDGEIVLKRLPCKKGQTVEMTLSFDSCIMPTQRRLTARRLLRSGLVDIWKDRKDIGESAAFARGLRERAQMRQG